MCKLLGRVTDLLATGILLIVAFILLVGCSSAGQRERVLEGYVRQQVEDYGWLENEISYEDNGEGNTVFVFFRPEDMWSQDILGYDDDMSQDEANALAEELNSVVFILGYTTDDRLVSTVAAEPPNFSELDEEAQVNAVEQLVDYQNEYIEFARAEAENWLSEYVANSRGYYEGLEDIQFLFDENRNAYVIMYRWSDGYCPAQDDQDAHSQWQWEANIISRSTASNIVLVHGTSDAGAQTAYVAEYEDNNMLHGYSPS